MLITGPDGSPKENKPPVPSDNGDLSNFLFYLADIFRASIFRLVCRPAARRLLPPVSYISRNGLFFFLPPSRPVSPPPPAASGAGDRGTPRRSSSVSSLSGPFLVCLADPTRQQWTGRVDSGLHLAN